MRKRLRSLTGGVSATPLAILLGVDALGEMDRVAFGVLLPEIRNWFGISLTTLLTLQTVGGLFIIAATVPVGFLADRVNRVRLNAAALVVFGVVTFFTGIAPSLFALAVIRLGSGLVRTIAPSQQSLLADSYPMEARTSVFNAFQTGEAIGRFLAPVAAGYMASAIGWQLPFLIIGPLSVVMAVVLVLWVREPPRGGHERAALGAEDLGEQEPPGFSESWRIAKGVRTLRRTWWALPFLVGALLSLDDVITLLFSDVFDLSAGARGTIISGAQPFRIAGLLAGAAVGERLFGRRPSMIVTVTGLIGVFFGLMLVVVAAAPSWPIAVAPFYLGSFATATVGPALISLMTMVIPPRARGFALGVGALFVAPGLLAGPVIGAISDRYGLRVGIVAAIPLFVIGALIIASAGPSVDADIRQARAAAAAAAASIVVGDGPQPMLVIRDLDVHYGGVQVLFNVDFDVHEGEIVALLGTNGAGKSTLLRAIAGTQTASNGAVFFDGEDITHLPPSAHALKGVVVMPGGKATFPSLTVREHLRLAASPYDDERDGIARVLDLFPRLRERLDQPAGELSGGEQQMLGLGQALLTRPRLLMIDELSLGLAPAVVGQLLEVVRAIHAQGTTVILVEQSINVAFTIAERAVFMEKGEVRFSGPTSELLGRSDILRAVFLSAGSGAGGGGRRVAQTNDVIFETVGLHKRYGGIIATDDVSLQLREGQILGIIGPNGSGKTTLFDLVSGYVEPDAGQITLLGQDVGALSPEQRSKLGLHRSFQDARLFPALTVEETVMVALEKRLEVRSALRAVLGTPSVGKAEAKVRRRADRLIDLLGLGGYRDTFVRELSTGTRRIVDLACVLGAEPTVLLLDEPSAGVAQRETEELGPLLQRVRSETGCSILLIEHDMPLISAVADELMAMDQGRVITRGLPDDVLNHPEVVAAYLGTSEAAVNRSS